MVVNIDKKTGLVSVVVPVDSDLAMLSSAMDACRAAHTATQLDTAKVAAMVAAKQAELDAILAAKPVVIAALAAPK